MIGQSSKCNVVNNSVPACRSVKLETFPGPTSHAIAQISGTKRATSASGWIYPSAATRVRRRSGRESTTVRGECDGQLPVSTPRHYTFNGLLFLTGLASPSTYHLSICGIISLCINMSARNRGRGTSNQDADEERRLWKELAERGKEIDIIVVSPAVNPPPPPPSFPQEAHTSHPGSFRRHRHRDTWIRVGANGATGRREARF